MLTLWCLQACRLDYCWYWCEGKRRLMLSNKLFLLFLSLTMEVDSLLTPYSCYILIIPFKVLICSNYPFSHYSSPLHSSFILCNRSSEAYEGLALKRGHCHAPDYITSYMTPQHLYN